jgi:4'-phosphopantetheinyl transferase
VLITGNWIPLQAPPPLPPGEVHLWRARVPEADRTPAAWTALLSPEEQAGVARKRIPVDARRTLTSRACLRLLLGRYLELPAAALEFTVNANGKPRLAGAAAAADLEFNVSHSGEWVALAFVRGVPVGVDVEGHRELDYGELAATVFSPSERVSWSALAPADHRRAFYSAWTRKEACVKALGLGLQEPPTNFSVTIAADPAPEIVRCGGEPSAPQLWHVTPVPLAPSYSCALAVAPGPTTLQTFTLLA